MGIIDKLSERILRKNDTLYLNTPFKRLWWKVFGDHLMKSALSKHGMRDHYPEFEHMIHDLVREHTLGEKK